MFNLLVEFFPPKIAEYQIIIPYEFYRICWNLIIRQKELHSKNFYNIPIL